MTIAMATLLDVRDFIMDLLPEAEESLLPVFLHAGDCSYTFRQWSRK
jgi:hypothetical protein